LFWLSLRASELKNNVDGDFYEVLEQVLGLGSLTREKFFMIFELMNKKNLSKQEFSKLLEIIKKQQSLS